MLRYFFLIVLLLTGFLGYSQATLFTENFESGGTAWSASGDITPNFWEVNSCAGNGSSQPGSNAMYITEGTSVACGNQFAYTNSVSGTNTAIFHTTVDGTCASSLQVNFDYSIEGITAEDFCELVYSTDAGASWTAVGGELPISATWTNTTIALPGLLDGQSFELGFRFTYNDASINGAPISVDNILVTGTDTVDPLMTCPSTITQGVTTNCQAFADDYTKAILTLSDNCTDSVLIILTQDIPESTLFAAGPGGNETIIVTATDESGNSTQCSITVMIVDDMSPTPICPADTNVYVDVNCDGLIENYIGDVSVTDNCTSLANMIITQSPPAGTVINGSGVTTSITITATDEAGISETCTFNALTVDTMVATITCPPATDIYADAICQASIPDFTSLAVASDNCVATGALTITQSPAPGTVITADQMITLTVTGGIPAIDQSCVFNGVFVDTISPAIVCPTPSAISVDASCQALMTDYTGSVVVSDNCGVPTVSQTPLPGSTLVSATDVTVIMSVTDASGNSSSCQFTQPVVDDIDPTIACPGNQTVDADINCFGILGDYTSLATPSDNCTSVFTITQSPVPGATIAASTVVTLSINDESGNTGNCAFNVNIIDNLDPTITCPPTTTVSTDASCNYALADFSSSASASDNCTAAIDLVYAQSPTPGSTLGLGTTPITITVTDLNGNQNNCSFSLDVVDALAPTVSCPSNQNIIADASCEGLLGDYTSMAIPIDNCTSVGNITIQQSPIVGTTIFTDTPVTITVTDESGNSGNCVFNALLIDTISPSVTCPSGQTLSTNGSCQYTVPDFSSTVAGTDNCSAFGDMTISQNPPAGSTEDGITSVFITLIDEQGNSSSCVTLLTPDDIVAPTITCPNPPIANAGSSCDYALLNYGTIASVVDNCPNFTIDQTPAPGTIVNPGQNSITLVVTDAGGNTDQCTFNLTVVENVDPTISCPADISSCDPVVSFPDPTFGDNCGASMSQTDLTGLTSGMSFPVGITTLEYTAVDTSGNTAVCNFNIEILDFPAPAVIAEDTISLCDQNSVVLSADAISSGSGLWTVDAGQGNFNNQFANSTGVNNLGIGSNVFIWTVSSASCGSLSDTVVVINSQLDLDASTQDTILACSETSINLLSNAPLYGTGTWTTDNGAVIDDINSANTNATLVNAGWQEFVWTITNGGCPSTSDTLHVLSNATGGIITSDTSVCLENGSMDIVGSAPEMGQSVNWMVISGTGSVSPEDDHIAVVSGLSLGVNLFTYATSYPGCPTTYDTLSIIGTLCDGFDPLIPTMITPNFDGKNDLFIIDYLEQSYPECRVVIFNRWGSVVFESIGYSSPWDGTFKGEPLPMGTYFYKIELNDEQQTVFKGDISIIH